MYIKVFNQLLSVKRMSSLKKVELPTEFELMAHVQAERVLVGTVPNYVPEPFKLELNAEDFNKAVKEIKQKVNGIGVQRRSLKLSVSTNLNDLNWQKSEITKIPISTKPNGVVMILIEKKEE